MIRNEIDEERNTMKMIASIEDTNEKKQKEVD